MTEFKLGRYRHYKHHNHYYQVIDLALHTETQEKMVVYRALHEIPELTAEWGANPLFVRALSIFTETVMVDGVEKSRFEYVGE